jgi:hypothetical protein
MIDDVRNDESEVNYQISQAIDKVIDKAVDYAKKYLGKNVRFFYGGIPYTAPVVSVDYELLNGDKWFMIFYIDIPASDNKLRTVAVSSGEIVFV